MLDLYAPDPTPGVVYPEAIIEADHYSLCQLERIGYHDAAHNPLHWFLKENSCVDKRVELLRGGMRREVFGENPLLSKHTLVRNAPPTLPMVHPHCASRVAVADVTLCLRHYKLAGDWLKRDASSTADAAWEHGEDAKRLSVAERGGFRIAPAKPRAWRGATVLEHEDFLYASPAARLALVEPT
jgi:hypothetical protein